MYIFTPNTLINSAQVNANFLESADAAYHNNIYKASAKLASTQSVGANAITIIAFATEEFDTNNNFNNTAGNYDYTAPLTGYYQINATTQATLNSKLNSAIFYVYKNGNSIRQFANAPPTFSSNMSFAYCELLYLTSGDKIQFRILSSTSDNSNFTLSTNATFCSFYFVCK